MAADRRVDAAQLQELADATQTLADSVADLARGAGVQLVSLARRSVVNRRLIWVTIGSLALDVLLTGALGLAGWQLNSNADRIDALTHRLDVSQTTTRRQALCPMYQVFLDMQSAEGRRRAPDPEKYDNAFRVIRQGYEALDCDQYISEPQGPVGSTPSSTP